MSASGNIYTTMVYPTMAQMPATQAAFSVNYSPTIVNVAVGMSVTAAGSSTTFTTGTVTAVSAQYVGSGSEPLIDITINIAFDNSDPDNILYTFTTPAAPAPAPAGGVTCFVAGTRVLTGSGYKAIETLTKTDRIVTSEGREVSAKVYSFELPTTTKTSAPYRIEAGAFGRGLPAAPIALSPIHKIQMRPHLWTSPHDAAAGGNSLVKQYGVGEPIRYYHIECENYLRDNIMTEGLVVESLGHEGHYKGVQVYTWSKRFQGYTRISADTKVAGR